MLKKILAAMVMLYAAVSFAAVDVNKATAAELDGIKGVGPAMSAKILAEKKKGGDFKNWDDLVTRVKGIGENNSVKLSAEGLTVGGESFKGVAAKPTAKKADKPVAAKDAKDAKPAATEAKADAKPAAAKTEAPKADAKVDAKAAAKEVKADAKPAAAAKTEAPKADAKADAKAAAKEVKADAKPAAAAKDAKPAAKDAKSTKAEEPAKK